MSAGMSSPVADKRNFFHGTVVDLAMRRWLEQDDPQPGWMAAHVDEILEKAEIESRETGDGMVKWRDRDDKARVRPGAGSWSPGWSRFCSSWSSRSSISRRGGSRCRSPSRAGRAAARDCAARRDGPVHPQPGHAGDFGAGPERHRGHLLLAQGRPAQLVFYEIAVRLLTGQWPEVSRLIQPMCPEPVLTFHLQRGRPAGDVRDHLRGRGGHLAWPAPS